MIDNARMLRFHREGLQRVARIIDGNPNYDALMGEKLSDSELALFDDTLGIAERRRHAIQMAGSRVGTLPINIIRPRFEGFVCEGRSRNNLQEFAFFDTLLGGIVPKLASQNYSFCHRYSCTSLSAPQQAALDAVIDDIRSFYRSHTAITASLVRQQILYSRSFLGFLIAFTDKKAVAPAALVQANDHSPVRVALSMIMKGMDVPRIYLQHAEVSQHFPPLDFDHSVLRNAQSLDVYRQIGPVEGETYVISRHGDAFARQRLARSRGDRASVVIYPTSTVRADELRQTIDILHANPAIERILIKQHPGARRPLKDQIDTAYTTLIDTIPDWDHVALVGNSSVAMELLHRGIPVYQNFDFDPVDRDYYGFVKDGVTIEVDRRMLAEAFWRPYELSETWLERYARWDPTADETHGEEKAKFIQAMRSLAGGHAVGSSFRKHLPPMPAFGRSRERIKGFVKPALIRLINANQGLVSRAMTFLVSNTDLKIGHTSGRAASVMFIERTLSDLNDPADWLLLNEKIRAFPAVDVILAIEEMFQKRNPALKTIFEGLSRWPFGASAGTWAYLKKLDLANLAPDREELDAIAASIYRLEGDKELMRHLERSLLSTILRFGTVEQLDAFWTNASVFHPGNLPVNKQIDVLRKLRRSGADAAEVERMRAVFDKRASPFDRLKFDNMDALDRNASGEWNHLQAEERFSQVAPRGVAEEFAASVKPAYDALRPRMRFMDTRTNAAEADQLLSLARDALRHGQAFSLIRLSDGEGYLFPDGPFFDASDAANRERHWWGVELTADLRAAIREGARAAVAEADVVGIPSVYRFIRDHTDSSRSLALSIQGRGLLQVLDGVAPLLSASASIAEDKVNVSAFGDMETVKPLIDLAGRVVVVGSVRRESLPPALREARKVELVAIPTHHKTSLNEKYHGGDESLPFVYPALLGELDALSRPGDLVLVAGGIIGKIFAGHARRQGAVALDIGSVLDDWAQDGMPTMR
ncbi:hypothetical protein [Nitratireductor pacificus]|uniref:Uncharacterized protein n=1 Tax=Nitratireductor pacificus pht-3B TaxID=391937 RepID=K2LI12_9HYPH|nr:hypothetical protein [Nitratireductor pacificus]EKF17394.1 hypothetical protein NA2_18470 [Nitratireductor pacificus pht-3B]